MSKLVCDLIILVVSTLILATATTAIILWKRIGRGERVGAAVLAVLALMFIAAIVLGFNE